MHKQYVSRKSLGRIVLLAGFALVLYGVVPQIGGLRESWRVVMHANIGLLLAAVGLLALTNVAAALIYQQLSLYRLQFLRTLTVEVACGLAGKLLPAGIGSLGLNAAYLRSNHHKLREALAVVAANNTLGFVAYLAVLAAAVVSLGTMWPSVHIARHTIFAAAIGLVLVALLIATLVGKRAIHSLRMAIQGLRTYQRHPLRLVLALLCAATLPCLLTGVVYYAAQALGYHVSLSAAFAAFSASQIVGSITPTPGGIVGAEAGLAGSLVAYGLNADHAIIVALLYRLITYWLPMVPGGIALLWLRTRLAV
ncbi:MAG TPA: lysylphosphatidylglycerol synthase transmembrane domain-containing protein [Candidatus Saccharimonadales bacterium]|nr:lysylphosphatidylglycerol synthase transmembrane domain-containing protein [Candidatus Saccharimonadales bacterium]